jgi:superfamily II RNA helicase
MKYRLTQLTHQVDKNDLIAMGSFEGMLAVLKKMKFVSEESILLKGRIAREVDVYVAEILVEAVLDNLEPIELAALLSGFVNQYRHQDRRNKDRQTKISPWHPKDTYTEPLRLAIDQTIDIVRKFNIT